MPRILLQWVVSLSFTFVLFFNNTFSEEIVLVDNKATLEQEQIERMRVMASDMGKLSEEVQSRCKQINVYLTKLVNLEKGTQFALSNLNNQLERLNLDRDDLIRRVETANNYTNFVSESGVKIASLAEKNAGLAKSSCARKDEMSRSQTVRERDELMEVLEDIEQEGLATNNQARKIFSSVNERSEKVKDLFQKIETWYGDLEEFHQAQAGLKKNLEELRFAQAAALVELAAAQPKQEAADQLQERAEQLGKTLRKRLEGMREEHAESADMLAQHHALMQRIEGYHKTSRSALLEHESDLRHARKDLKPLEERGHTRLSIYSNFWVESIENPEIQQLLEQSRSLNSTLEFMQGYMQAFSLSKERMDKCLALAREEYARPMRVEVPKLYGLTIEKAQARLDRLGLILEERDEGLAPSKQEAHLVVRQSPMPGTYIFRGATVQLYVYGAYENVNKMPNFKGLSLNEARAKAHLCC